MLSIIADAEAARADLQDARARLIVLEREREGLSDAGGLSKRKRAGLTHGVWKRQGRGKAGPDSDERVKDDECATLHDLEQLWVN